MVLTKRKHGFVVGLILATIAVSSRSTIPVSVEASSSLAWRSLSWRPQHRHEKRAAGENPSRRSPRSMLFRITGGRKSRDGNSRNLETTATASENDDGDNPVLSTTTAQKKEEEESEGGVYVDKPVLRGQFHKWGAIVYPPLMGIPLHLRALARTRSIAAAVAAQTQPMLCNPLKASLLFGFAVESIMVVSATLHTFPWKTEKWHRVARKLDFTAIFVGIASLYSSMGRMLMGQNRLYARVIEPVVWACAGVGSLIKWCVPDAPHWANGAIFLVQGWAGLPCIPTLVRSAALPEVSGIVGGGIFVTLGALAYSLQWPRNKRNKAQKEIVFGPHELFHVGTLCMVASFWYTMWVKVSSTRAI